MSAPSLGPSDSPISRLYRHALESIFAALTLRELHCIAQVSKEWIDIVQRMASIGAAVTLESPDACCRSSLACHVGHYKGLVRAPASALTLLAEHIPRLSSLHWSLASNEWSHAAPFVLPPRLQSLSMALPFQREGGTGLWGLYDAVAPLTQLHTLQLKLSIVPRQMRVAALSRLPALTSFSLIISFAVIPIAVVEDLRLFPSLRSLSLDGIDGQALSLLFAEPHNFHRLEHVELLKPCDVNEQSVAPLLPLAELTSLSLVVSVTRPEFISRWASSLQSLSLVFQCDTRTAAALPWPALHQCTQLTRLSLRGAPLNSTELCATLIALPQLKSICLHCMVSLDRDWWSGLSRVPSIVPSLTELRFESAGEVSESDLAHLHGVTTLRSLHLRCHELTDALSAAYAVPSVWMPQLTHSSLEPFLVDLD